jgi:hypothetical protein
MKKKLFKKRGAKQEASSSRITNETVAEHRERILAGGRKFKYPVQYARHRLVINAIIIAIVAVIILIVVGWWQLYSAQNTGTFVYRVTKVLPLSVASIDGESVRYSDYLMRLRSQEYWLAGKGQIEQGKKDNERQINYIKRSVINGAEADAYAAKLAREKNITVTDKEVDGVVKRSLQTANGTISQELYDASTLETLGYDRDEYRLLIRQSLLRHKVSYALDTQASQMAEQVGRLITADRKANLDAIAQQVGNGVQSGTSGLVRKTNQDGGITQAALKLSVGQTSAAIKSTTGDGYYFVRLLESTTNELSYHYVKVPLTSFNQAVSKLREQGKVKELISIPQAQTQLIK